jgi:hypothetical protein
LSNDILWAITVVIGFSTLLVLSYFILTPMVNDQSMLERTDAGLKKAVDKFKQLKERNQESDQFDLNT